LKTAFLRSRFVAADATTGAGAVSSDPPPSVRFYYFLFYVLHAYVDSRYKYAGIVALRKFLASKRKAGDR